MGKLGSGMRGIRGERLGCEGGEGYFLGVSSGKSEMTRYSNHFSASAMALRRALLGVNSVSVISGSSVRIARV